jgi:hypothetical protein
MSRSSASRRSRGRHPAAGKQQLTVAHDDIPCADLADVPISDHFAEKKAIEAIEEDRWGDYLLGIAGKHKGIMTPENRQMRIIEVYRRCFEESRDDSVLRDFVVHFPELTFDAPWLASLVKASCSAL